MNLPQNKVFRKSFVTAFHKSFAAFSELLSTKNFFFDNFKKTKSIIKTLYIKVL
ncbi:hypothetical protein CLAVI_000472 [Candidatus Clavichlamydia salmonicola]|nr:hypothetical protein [Candidatus Clavichlamydia salmonicola]